MPYTRPVVSAAHTDPFARRSQPKRHLDRDDGVATASQLQPTMQGVGQNLGTLMHSTDEVTQLRECHLG